MFNVFLICHWHLTSKIGSENTPKERKGSDRIQRIRRKMRNVLEKENGAIHPKRAHTFWSGDALGTRRK